MAHSFQAGPKSRQRARVPRERHGDFDHAAEVKRFERGLFHLLQVLAAVFGNNLPEIGAQFGDGDIVANIDAGQPFGEHGLIEGRQRPLGKIVRKAFSEEVVPAQALEGMVENRGVAACSRAWKSSAMVWASSFSTQVRYAAVAK
jgi:hypothetical protein